MTRSRAPWPPMPAPAGPGGSAPALTRPHARSRDRGRDPSTVAYLGDVALAEQYAWLLSLDEDRQKLESSGIGIGNPLPGWNHQSVR